MINLDSLPDEISIVWCIADVKEVAPDLSNEQCRLVLYWAKRHHDATIGINWDVLKNWAEEARNTLTPTEAKKYVESYTSLHKSR